MNSYLKFTKIDPVNQELLDLFLEPYKTDCRYLKEARFKYLETNNLTQESEIGLIEADFSILESCYIADTGHFNSVEFNICYNQLFYVLIAYLLKHNLLSIMEHWDLDTYKRRQLSDFLIVKFSSTFRKSINSRNFQGNLSINKSSARGHLILLKTSCSFYDNQGGLSEGDVTIAVLNNKSKKTIDSSAATVLV